MEIYLTTSASSLLITSIDAARRQMVHDGERLIDEALRLARRLRAGARELGLQTIEPEAILQRDGAWEFNERHVTIDVQSLGMTGYKAGDWLRGQRAVAVELADHRRVMAALSHADTHASVDRAPGRVARMVDEFSGPTLTRSSRPVPGPAELRTEQVMRPRDAFFAATESTPIAEAAGRIAAEFVTPYPPGVPLFVPGERITEAIVEYLGNGAAEGIYVEGCADQSLGSLRVVSQQD